MKDWVKPAFELIDMNAEIGAYQEDYDGDRERDAKREPAAERRDAAATPPAEARA